MADVASTSSKGGGGVRKEILDDLASRFLVNLPEVERCDPVRVCFQAELAHWFYIDHYCPDPAEDCRPVGIREFIRLLFHHVSFLKPLRGRVDAIVDEWRRYKAEVPTYGAALLSPCLRYILLVQGFYAKNSWGFPKGKVNEDEDPHVCAAREVHEEVGFDISSRISKRRYLETRYPSHTRLYLVPNVPLDTVFAPRTRKEIRKIQWFRLSCVTSKRLRDLPASRGDTEPPTAIGMAPNNFYTVQCFVEDLQRWCVREAGKRNLPDPVHPPAHRSAFHPPNAAAPGAPTAAIPSAAVASLLLASADAADQRTILVFQDTDGGSTEPQGSSTSASPTKAPGKAVSQPPAAQPKKAKKKKDKGAPPQAKTTDSDPAYNNNTGSATWCDPWSSISVEELLRPWAEMKISSTVLPSAAPPAAAATSPQPISLQALGL